MKKMYSRLALLAALLTVSLTLTAQSLQEKIRQKTGGEPNIFRMQEGFDAWAEGKDLNQVRGWKPLRRMLHTETTRVQNDGSYPDAATFLQALEQVDQAYNGAQSRSGSPWVPVGPSAPPEPKNSGHGGIGRINCVEFHPTDPNTLYVGAPDGGIWKTSNHGQSWIPLGDQLPVPGVSAILVDPQQPETIYIGTGDSEFKWVNSASDTYDGTGVISGVGVLKSTDGGTTWAPTGLTINVPQPNLSVINTLLTDPAATSNLLASSGSGIWRSTDAGVTWTKTLNGPVDVLEQDPGNPQVVYGALSDYYLTNPYGKPTIVRSVDFGMTWTALPLFSGSETVQRLAVRVAPSNSNIIYVAAVHQSGGGLYRFYRSENGGQTWTVQFHGTTRNLLGYQLGVGTDTDGNGAYNLVLRVDPQNPDRCFLGGVNLWGTEDGGQTWSLTTHQYSAFGPSVHADLHALEYNPLNNGFYLGSDGGLSFSTGLSIGDWPSINQCAPAGTLNIPAGCYALPTAWTNISNSLAISQFYKLDVFDNDANYIIAGAQDNQHSYLDNGQWYTVFDSDGMDCFFHPTNPATFYGARQYGDLRKTANGGDTYASINSGIAEQQGSWVTPFEPKKGSPTILYAGFSQVLKYVPFNGWSQISNFPGSQQCNELIVTPSNPEAVGILKTGASPGTRQIWVTKNGGTEWKKISTGFTAIGLATPTDICYGNTDEEVYVTFGGFNAAYKVYRTLDYGATWQNITKNLPNIPVTSIAHYYGSSNHLVYIGTDFGVYYTTDEMDGWEPFVAGLPRVRVSDIDLHYQSGKIFIATFGRGIWSNDFATVGASEPPIRRAEMSVAPNPNRGAFTVHIDRLDPGDYQLAVIDVLGRSHIAKTLRLDGASQQLPLESALPSGLYYLQLSQGKHSKTVTFMVQD
jgi:photosystem II stability/assembly factor-like uncharacterized protein